MLKRSLVVCGFVVFMGICGVFPVEGKPAEEKKEKKKEVAKAQVIKPAPIAPFVKKGLAWLIAAQHKDGGWGAGSHASQNVRDPHGVQTDPATTAFTCLSLLRAGHTPVKGEYQDAVRRATEYLVAAVEEATDEGPRITDLTGTQPQSKLGPNIDTSLTAQYLARALALVPKNDSLYARVDKALDKCLAKLQASQMEDGSWGRAGGWAPVLQSSLSCSALEIAQANGKVIDVKKLDKARLYLNGNIDAATGRAKASEAAGVELYAFGGGYRANAGNARAAQDAVQQAKREGKLSADAPVNEQNLRVAGVPTSKVNQLAQAAAQNDAQTRRLDDEQLLAGFGNNGGEEYLSYLMTSETLVIAGGEKFHPWNDKMQGRLAKIQSNDGSWTGHHCITSPVFCTAAVVQCLTADRDAPFLVSMAKQQQDAATKLTQKD